MQYAWFGGVKTTEKVSKIFPKYHLSKTILLNWPKVARYCCKSDKKIVVLKFSQTNLVIFSGSSIFILLFYSPNH